MRVLFYLYVFIGISQSVTYSQPFSIDTVQKMFLYAMEDDDMNAALYRYLSQWNFTDNALLLAYKGSSRAMMARSATWPATKYKYFTEGRDNIEKAIQLQPAHPEIRFLRLMIQLHIPPFLKYNTMEADREFLVQYFGKKRPAKGSFEETMVRLIIQYGKLSASQKAMLEKGY